MPLYTFSLSPKKNVFEELDAVLRCWVAKLCPCKKNTTPGNCSQQSQRIGFPSFKHPRWVLCKLDVIFWEHSVALWDDSRLASWRSCFSFHDICFKIRDVPVDNTIWVIGPRVFFQHLLGESIPLFDNHRAVAGHILLHRYLVREGFLCKSRCCSHGRVDQCNQ